MIRLTVVDEKAGERFWIERDDLTEVEDLVVETNNGVRVYVEHVDPKPGKAS